MNHVPSSSLKQSQVRTSQGALPRFEMKASAWQRKSAHEGDACVYVSILDTDVAEIAEGLSNLKPGERYSFGCSAIDKEHPEPRVPREGRYDFSGFRVELSRDARSMASIDPSWFFNMGRYDGSTLSADSNFVTLSLSKAGLAVFTKALVLSSVVETYVGNLQVSARIGHTGPLLGTSSEGIVIVWPRRSHGLAGR